MAKSNSPRAPTSPHSFEIFIKGWYEEVKDFPPGNVGRYGSTGNLGHTGHYSQVEHTKIRSILSNKETKMAKGITHQLQG